MRILYGKYPSYSGLQKFLIEGVADQAALKHFFKSKDSDVEAYLAQFDTPTDVAEAVNSNPSAVGSAREVSRVRESIRWVHQTFNDIWREEIGRDPIVNRVIRRLEAMTRALAENSPPDFEYRRLSQAEIEIRAYLHASQWAKKRFGFNPREIGIHKTTHLAEVGRQKLAEVANRRGLKVTEVSLVEEYYWGQIAVQEFIPQFDLQVERERRRLESEFSRRQVEGQQRIIKLDVSDWLQELALL